MYDQYEGNIGSMPIICTCRSMRLASITIGCGAYYWEFAYEEDRVALHKFSITADYC